MSSMRGVYKGKMRSAKGFIKYYRGLCLDLKEDLDYESPSESSDSGDLSDDDLGGTMSRIVALPAPDFSEESSDHKPKSVAQAAREALKDLEEEDNELFDLTSEVCGGTDKAHV